MKTPLIVSLCIGLALVLSVQAQESLDNQSIIKIVQSGLGDDLVIQMIKTQPGRYVISADEIVALKKAGVSEKVIGAMIAKNSSVGTPSPTEGPIPGTGDTGVTEVGLYYKKDNVWTELLPEVVNWKTGGTWKSIGTVGIIKKDVNGNIPGLHSLNSIKDKLEFLIYAPEGVTYTEYQLLRLRPNNKGAYREFRTITGGVFNQSSGAQRDMVPFEAKKIAPRKFNIILPNNLGAGEYGFIYMGATGSSGGTNSMTMGKMYTFRIPE